MNPSTEASIRFAAFVLVLGVHARAHVVVADVLPPGAIVRIGGGVSTTIVTTAVEASRSEWRLESATEASRVADTSIAEGAVRELETLYFEAEFLRCLARMQRDDVSYSVLIAANARALGGRVLLVSSGCAFSAGDLSLATTLLTRVVTAEHDLGPLAAMSQEFQTWADPIVQRATTTPRAHLTVRSTPSDARVLIDGRTGCAATPCELDVRRGPHVISLERIGFMRRDVSQDVTDDGAVSIALDASPAPLLRTQLADSYAAQHRSGGGSESLVLQVSDVPRAAADAFGVGVVLMLAPRPNHAEGLIYDRARDRIIGRYAIDGERAEDEVVRHLASEWRGATVPTPIFESPWFWIAIAASAAIVGTVVFLVTQPPEQRFAFDVRS